MFLHNLRNSIRLQNFFHREKESYVVTYLCMNKQQGNAQVRQQYLLCGIKETVTIEKLWTFVLEVTRIPTKMIVERYLQIIKHLDENLITTQDIKFSRKPLRNIQFNHYRLHMFFNNMVHVVINKHKLSKIVSQHKKNTFSPELYRKP